MRFSKEVCAMDSNQKYAIAQDGEIVKILEGQVEYTGMYVVD